MGFHYLILCYLYITTGKEASKSIDGRRCHGTRLHWDAVNGGGYRDKLKVCMKPANFLNFIPILRL